MIMKALRLVGALIVIMTGSCREDEPDPIQLSLNGDMESGSGFPESWFNFKGTDGTGNYSVEWTNNDYRSPSRSLKISSAAKIADSFAYWGQQKCGNIPKGKSVTLKARIKGNLSGAGVSIAIRCDPAGTGSSSLLFVSTQGNTEITGTFDWREYTLASEAVPDATSCILVFLVLLPNTSGEVYFDDVALTYK